MKGKAGAHCMFTSLLCAAAQLRLQSHLGMSLQWAETAPKLEKEKSLKVTL